MREPEAATLLESIPEDERFASWYLVMPAGSVIGGGAAGLALLNQFFSSPRADRVLKTRALEWLAHRGYALVARNRHRFGRWVVDRPGPRRFP
jgi:hypothetical protein